MMNDHETLCRARNELCDALKVLLQPQIMGSEDFVKALSHVYRAERALNELGALGVPSAK